MADVWPRLFLKCIELTPPAELLTSSQHADSIQATSLVLISLLHHPIFIHVDLLKRMKDENTKCFVFCCFFIKDLCSTVWYNQSSTNRACGQGLQAVSSLAMRSFLSGPWIKKNKTISHMPILGSNTVGLQTTCWQSLAFVPREWTGSQHKVALLPCLTGTHSGTGMEPKVHTEGWTRLRTVQGPSWGPMVRYEVYTHRPRCCAWMPISHIYQINPKYRYTDKSSALIGLLLPHSLPLDQTKYKVLPWTPSSPPQSGSGHDRTWRWYRWIWGRSSPGHDGLSAQAETEGREKKKKKSFKAPGTLGPLHTV